MVFIVALYILYRLGVFGGGGGGKLLSWLACCKHAHAARAFYMLLRLPHAIPHAHATLLLVRYTRLLYCVLAATGKQVSASHILVKSEERCAELRAELDAIKDSDAVRALLALTQTHKNLHSFAPSPHPIIKLDALKSPVQCASNALNTPADLTSIWRENSHGTESLPFAPTPLLVLACAASGESTLHRARQG